MAAPLLSPPLRPRSRKMHISRFTQLLIFSCVVLFVPTYLYLRPSSYHLSAVEGTQAPKGLVGGEVKMGSQGWGPVAIDEDSTGAGSGSASGSSWSKWVDPARMKSGDFWKSGWKTPWAAVGAVGGSAAKDSGGGSVAPSSPGEVVVAPAAGQVGTAAGVIPAANGGEAFATKMANATAKAELGRHTWHFLHLLTLRFPDKPTPEQRTTLSTFFHTFSLLYPCGECANHFQQLLKEMPVQTSSRMNAALWLCAAHNRVNERLGKPEFPCDKLDESYDCGCGPDPTSSKTILLGPSLPATAGVFASTAGLLQRSEIGGEAEDTKWMMGRSVEECRACRGAFAGR
ncbi:hypothetical protein BCV69DRAFT_298142 [Microstroma glucosiphilum]|uniref:Sulfhydryl oxidase n=1 Tax=Pseudomicrostroma glucosiphilum TaxID=1684307 RepID=A0A316UC12_9BASI|nr:hypothetical protein BCV69DRAFT_298142 [Pseudomicrostroma glucosiphilum]PWN21943.1 hypothetical protein BCV69DRAFT_298142 [Pseudomicrostroma glucosiphilum]